MKNLKSKCIRLLLLFSLVLASKGFAQVETSDNSKAFQHYFQSVQIEPSNYLGYQFQEGELFSFPINDYSNLQTGIFREKTGLYQSITVPVLLRHKLTKNLHLFYGAKFQNVIGSEVLGNLSNRTQMFLELGLQYDVSNNLMLELGSSFMLNNSDKTYRYQLDNSAKNLLKLGAGYKF